MNPFRELAEMDKTELAATRIRETEATKRALLVEKETTYRQTLANKGKEGFIVRHAITVAGMVIISCVGYHAYSARLKALHPTLPCNDALIHVGPAYHALLEPGVHVAICPFAGQNSQTLDKNNETFLKCECK